MLIYNLWFLETSREILNLIQSNSWIGKIFRLINPLNRFYEPYFVNLGCESKLFLSISLGLSRGGVYTVKRGVNIIFILTPNEPRLDLSLKCKFWRDIENFLTAKIAQWAKDQVFSD